MVELTGAGLRIGVLGLCDIDPPGVGRGRLAFGVSGLSMRGFLNCKSEKDRVLSLSFIHQDFGGSMRNREQVLAKIDSTDFTFMSEEMKRGQ